MANLVALRARTREVKADLGDGDVLNITYRPGQYTPEFERQAQEAAAARDTNLLARIVCTLVVDWDLYEDAKQTKKVPITAERIVGLPMLVVGPVLEAIGDDMRPNSRSAGTSGAGSMEP